MGIDVTKKTGSATKWMDRPGLRRSSKRQGGSNGPSRKRYGEPVSASSAISTACLDISQELAELLAVASAPASVWGQGQVSSHRRTSTLRLKRGWMSLPRGIKANVPPRRSHASRSKFVHLEEAMHRRADKSARNKFAGRPDLPWLFAPPIA